MIKLVNFYYNEKTGRMEIPYGKCNCFAIHRIFPNDQKETLKEAMRFKAEPGTKLEEITEN